MIDLPGRNLAVLDGALRALGVAEADLDAERGFVADALRRARVDQATDRARKSRSDETTQLKRIGKLAAKAAGDDGKALGKLITDIDDGLEVDALVAAGLSDETDLGATAASSLARAVPSERTWWAGVLARACERATYPQPRRRRDQKFFSVLALAFVFIDLTGEIPTFSTRDESSDDDAKARWARYGRFADFVTSVDDAFSSTDLAIKEGHLGFDSAIPEVLRVASFVFAAHAGFYPIRVPPPPFAGASFPVIEKGDLADNG